MTNHCRAAKFKIKHFSNRVAANYRISNDLMVNRIIGVKIGYGVCISPVKARNPILDYLTRFHIWRLLP